MEQYSTTPCPVKHQGDTRPSGFLQKFSGRFSWLEFPALRQARHVTPETVVFWVPIYSIPLSESKHSFTSSTGRINSLYYGIWLHQIELPHAVHQGKAKTLHNFILHFLLCSQYFDFAIIQSIEICHLNEYQFLFHSWFPF